eukprot:CAMPEP_0170754206 /NCGR_PEP_ID=MMETSP0437-20130122/12886_1 /TAXON_ID=0 /ORGANISM="Sexangularia sp." /LENGTH=217 /DNA_ID=CAMNT_0011093343 /DNA_START=79 /DNA_END=728 /DNA_ORIENTATION=+
MNMLCNAMPFMTACLIRDVCEGEHGEHETEVEGDAALTVCDMREQFAFTCTKDTGMSGMMGCANYTTLCGSGNCSTGALDGAPMSMMALDDAMALCSDAAELDECSMCVEGESSNCNTLHVLGASCGASHEVANGEHCGAWRSWCCGADGGSSDEDHDDHDHDHDHKRAETFTEHNHALHDLCFPTLGHEEAEEFCTQLTGGGASLALSSALALIAL